MDITKLRTNYPVFTYQSYNWKIDGNDLVINWQMGVPEYQFNPSIRILNAKEYISKTDKNVIDNFIFNLGIIESFSYWKAFCSPEINILAGYLDEYQKNFYRDLLLKGMGQYFYENNLSYTQKDFIIISSPTHTTAHCSAVVRKNSQSVRNETKKTLIAVGGGKDSAVALELLTKNFSTESLGVFMLNDNNNPAITKLVEVSGITSKIQVVKTIDAKLLELNKQGFLNGHTPFSAYLALLSVFCAVIFDYEDIVFSNERSANEGNAQFLGFEFNHQYSKTVEFENKFREYNQKYLSDKNYFSILRPLYDLQIMKIFSKNDNYFLRFLSCNKGAISGRWCGKCPKCLSTYVCLYPFLTKEKILSIFGRDLFIDNTLLDLTHRMIGDDTVKPFECIGTREELKIAFYLSFQKEKNPENLILLKYFKQTVLPEYQDWDERTDKLLKSWDDNNNLPENYFRILKKEIG